MDKHIDAAITWLSESDIRNTDEAKVSFGGISNGYFYRDKTYQYVYNEITGYAINVFIAIYKWTGEEKYLRYSKNAADYLIRQQNPDTKAFESKAISHSLVFPDLTRVSNCYSFDNAIILHGLVNLFNVTGDEKYRHCCQELGDWLTTMQKTDGSFYSHYDVQEKSLHHPYDDFFYDNGCLHVKNAIGLIYLGQLSGDNRYTDAGLKACDWGIRLLANDGLFWANTNRKYVFTHAHCYATEGYLYAYQLSRQDEYLAVAQKAADALISLQNEDGSLYRIYKNKITMRRWFGTKYKMAFRQWRNERKIPWKTVDATAQSARIWALLHSVTSDGKYLIAAEQAIEFIQNNQILDSDDQNMRGGFYYQRSDKNQGIEATLSNGMYTWCTQFGLSAYMMVQMAKNDKPFGEIIEFLY